MSSHNACIRFRQRGFTLIELLVVVLILSILMAVALPLYLSAVADSQKKTCRTNMQTIANVVVAAKTQNNFPDYTILIGKNRNSLDINPLDSASGSLPDLQAVPTCPSGGTYSLRRGRGRNNSTFRVRCSAFSHGSFEPGRDHN